MPSRAEPTPTMVAVMRDMILIENFNLAAAEAAGLGDDYKRDIGNSTGCEGYRGDDAEALEVLARPSSRSPCTYLQVRCWHLESTENILVGMQLEYIYSCESK